MQSPGSLSISPLDGRGGGWMIGAGLIALHGATMTMDSSPDLGTTEDHSDVERRVRAQIREPRRSSVRSVWLYYYTNGRVRASTMSAGAGSPAPTRIEEGIRGRRNRTLGCGHLIRIEG